jgi:hypothetical protein
MGQVEGVIRVQGFRVGQAIVRIPAGLARSRVDRHAKQEQGRERGRHACWAHQPAMHRPRG